MITIHLEGQPRGKGRPRFGKGRTYTDPKTKTYEQALALKGKEAMKGELIEGPLTVIVCATFEVPKSWPKYKKEAALRGELKHTTKPDIDNIVKMLDALNGIVFKDDSQIYSILAVKTYGEPGLEINIKEG